VKPHIVLLFNSLRFVTARTRVRVGAGGDMPDTGIEILGVLF